MSGRMIPTALLRCDARDCLASFCAQGNVSQVRRSAVAHGWIFAVRVNEKQQGPSARFDFCPKHHDKLEVVRATEVRP